MEGYRVAKWRAALAGAGTDSRAGHAHRRRGCSQEVEPIHDRTMRRLGDLPVFGDLMGSEVYRVRLAQLANGEVRLCAATSVRHAAQ